MKYSRVQMVEWAIDGFVALATVLLGLRVVFQLVAADMNASFIHWVYQVSDVLLVPFREVFPASGPAAGHPLDMAALFAIVAYLFLGYVLLALRGWASSSVKRR